MGYQTFKEVQRRFRTSPDPVLNDQINRVGRRIAAAANRPDFHWEFQVFQDDKTANAFCLPGGKVGIFTCMFKYLRSEGELATVIAHEAAHALARHSGERYSQAMLAQLGGMGLSLGLAGVNPMAGGAIMTGYELGANLGFLLPYSRKQETEADQIGMILMAKAGFDPALALDFWRQWTTRKKEKSAPPQFLSTHPSDETRIRDPDPGYYFIPAGGQKILYSARLSKRKQGDKGKKWKIFKIMLAVAARPGNFAGPF